MGEQHVVFGATGAMGSAIVRQLIAAGQPVLAVVRDEEKAQRNLPEDTEFSVADAMDADHVAYLCADAGVVYNCVHAVGDAWFTLTENLIAGARQAEARLVFPSNIHAYGPLQQVPATEEHPRLATSKRGVLRNTIEKMLLDAREEGGCEVVIPRVAAIYGPGVLDSFPAQVVEAAVSGKTAYWYAKLDVLCDMVYVEDAAAACILLGRSPDAASGENPVWHVPGAEPTTGRAFIERAFKAAGAKPSLGVRSRFFVQALGALVPTAKELAEVLYEFETPTLMDGGKLLRAFPDFRYTSFEDGLPQAVDWTREHLRGAGSQPASRRAG